MTLYHSTLKSNVASILENGLIPSESGIVYLSENPSSWWTDDDHQVLSVDTDGLDNRLTTFGNKNLDEILCWGRIPKDRISTPSLAKAH